MFDSIAGKFTGIMRTLSGKGKITALYQYDGLKKTPVQEATVGDIVAFSGSSAFWSAVSLDASSEAAITATTMTTT